MHSQLEEQIGQRLRRRGLRLAVAESCTGGLVGHRLTNIAGSSDYFLGGVLAYANEVKERVLGVRRETLADHGAVSRAAVIEMAAGARRVAAGLPELDHTVGLSISGIAGPGGGSAHKPVGLVWIGLSAPDGEWAWEHHFSGDRLEVKSQAAEQALQHLRAYLQKNTLQPVAVQTRAGAGGEPTPLSFSWQGGEYAISDWGRRWQDADGLHMLVMTPRQQTFELVLDPDGTRWYLNTGNIPPSST